MAAVCESLDALLGSVDDTDDQEETPKADHQAALCDTLIRSLDRLHSEQQKVAERGEPLSESGMTKSNSNFILTNLDYNNKRNERPKTAGRIGKGFAKFQETTVREVFADAQVAVSAAPPLLASLMMTRVETEKLLPSTQDAEANEDAMKDASAIMLTRPALVAAQLYSMLLTIPGALGSGLIEMQAVSSLAALFRRWRVECVTAMDILVSAKATTAKQKKSSKRQTGKRKPSKSSTTNPIKRRSGRKRTVVFAYDSSTDEEDEESADAESEDEYRSQKRTSLSMYDDGNDTGILSPVNLLLLGLKAARALSEVPMQKEFMSWSSAAREALLDAVTSLHGTVCALVTPVTRPKLGDPILRLQETVMNGANTCLRKCIFTALLTVDDDDDDAYSSEGTMSVSTKRHETSVFLFRGLYPVMAMREHLPNGEAGKQIACEQAADTLKGFVQAVSAEMGKENNLWTPRGKDPSASSRGKRSSVRRTASKTKDEIAGTPKMATKKGRKKRVSFGGVMETNGKTPMLKSAKKAALAASSSPSYSGTKPRPVLSAVLGLMQKLATTKGLDRANLRGSTVKNLHCCLFSLPHLEQTMMLRFIHQLMRSKVSVHRLTGTELQGRILAEPKLWINHANQPMKTPDSQPHSQIPATPPSKSLLNSPSSPKSIAGEDTVTPLQSEDRDIPTCLLEALIGRLVDRAPAVRACAAASLALVVRTISDAAQLDESDHFHALIELRKAIGSKAHNLTASLRERAVSEEKATVRRTVIEALTELMLLGTFDENFPVAICEEEVLVLGQLCNDDSLLVRKAAAQALTSLLARSTLLAEKGDPHSIDLVVRSWCFGILPMTLDAEAGCVVKAVELFHKVVILPILLEEDSDGFDERTAWRILALVCESSNSGTARNLTAALKASISKLTAPDSAYGDISKQLLKRICDVAVRTIDDPEDQLFEAEVEAKRSGVWCLFDALVDQTRKLAALYQALKKLRMDLDFLATSWERMLNLLDSRPDLSNTSTMLLRSCMKSCLRLLARMAVCVHIDTALKSATNLHSMLEKFVLPPDLIVSAVAALAATSIVCSGDEASIDQIRSDCSDRLTSLYSSCEETISSFAKQIVDGEHPPSEDAQEAALRALFTVGECAIVGFTPDENETHKSGQGKGKDSHATDVDPLKGLHIPPGKELIDVVMAFLPGQLLGSDRTPETARAHAFTSIGKVCMRSGQEQLAKRCVVIFAREIKENFKNGCPSVQSNALLVLGDLCCRYTNLVDRYLPVMATCLQSGMDSDNSIFGTAAEDKSVVVRKNAILLLSSLLLQDYIKFRGLLFFRFLVACADDDETVAQIGESMLVGPLLLKNPKLFSNNFVESLFVLNRCMHPIYLAAQSFGDGGAGIAVDFDGINLTGPAGKAKRFQMYELMLSRMGDEEKIGVTARLVKDVLGSAAEATSGALYKVCTNPMTQSDLDKAADRDYLSAFNVLSDTFATLSSPLFRVGKGSQSNDDDADIVEDPNLPNPARRVIAAKGKLLSKISRKHLIEVAFPILCNLKSVLQQSCSPLLKDLMQYMVHIFRGYKTEVKDFLVNDTNLLREIEFDAKRLSQGGPNTPSRGKISRPVSPEAADGDE